MSIGVSMVVDGMTGVGKTSLIDVLVAELDLKPYTEIFRDENDLLGKYYTEGSRWCFPMQLSFLNNRYSQYKEACTMENAVMDRSIYSDPIFAKLYYKTGDMEPEEYFVYKSIFRTLVDSLDPPGFVVYLDVPAQEAIRRIKMRGREDELKMPTSYWKNLHEVYTEYYDKFKLSTLLRIDVGDMDFVHSKADRDAIVKTIKDFYKKHIKKSRAATSA